MSTTSAPSEARLLRLPASFTLDSGAALPGAELAYRTWGTLSRTGDNAVVVCHALTGSADADVWWSALLGEGRALDPSRDFIVCSSILGSCYGSTGPASPAADGAPWGTRFPSLTVRDLVRAQQILLDALDVRGVKLVVGGSLGGMQALEWALLDERVEAAAILAAPARHEAWAMGWSAAQRQALDTARTPELGLAAARTIAMLSYRSPTSLTDRFGRNAGEDAGFAIQDWLAHHGRALVQRFDPQSYRVLLDVMDHHDVGHDRGGVAEALRSLHRPVLVLAISTDQLYPPAESEALAGLLPNAELVRFDSPHGHDGFLIEAARIGVELTAFRQRVEAQEPSGRGAR